MKKILLVLFGLIISANMSAFATCDYKCVAPYDMNSKFRKVIGAATGVNAITEKALEKVLKKEILKIGSAENLKVGIESYSSKDLKNGIFKSAQIDAENAVLNNIYLSELHLKTLCDFNYVKQSGSEIVFVEDLPLSFNLAITSNDLNRTMEHENYHRIINDLNKIGASYGYGVKIASTKAAIKNSKFYYILNIELPLVRKPQKIVFEANISVKDGKINYKNTKLVSGLFNLDLKKIDFILDYLNPLDFSVNIIKDKDANVKVKSIEIKNNKIIANGVIVIPKD